MTNTWTYEGRAYNVSDMFKKFWSDIYGMNIFLYLV